MKKRTILLSVAAVFAAAVVCFAANPNMGTWKLNEAKSKLSADPRKTIRWSMRRWATVLK